jgi:hypothetical protein
MLNRGRRSSTLARSVAFAAALVLAILASYELGMAEDPHIIRILPIALAVILLAALASPQVASAPKALAGEHTSGWERFGLELERSRRHARPLALLRLTRRRGEGSAAIDLDEVEAQVRAVDVAWSDRRHVYILLPETDRPALSRAIARLAASLPEIAEAELRLAIYPDDGITSGALISRLDASAAAPRGADIIQLAPHDAERPYEQLS